LKDSATYSHVYPLTEQCAVLPIEHKKLAYTLEVRQAIFEFNPQVVLLELPAIVEQEIHKAVSLLPIPSFIIYQHQEQNIYLPIDPSDARIEALRLCEEYGIQREIIDGPFPNKNEHQPMPDEWTLPKINGHKLGELIDQNVSLKKSKNLIQPEFIEGLNKHNADGERVLIICHANLIPVIRDFLASKPSVPIQNNENEVENLVVHLVKPRAAELPFLFGELPAITFEYEKHRRMESDKKVFDFDRTLKSIINDAIDRYETSFDEIVSLTEQRTYFQYVRNLSLLSNRLRPGLRELIQGAQGCVSDDFASVLLDILTIYPPLGDESTTYTDHYKSHHLYYDFGDGAQRLSPRYCEQEMGTLEFKFNRRQFSKQQKDEWQAMFWRSGMWGICSWPPEDVLIEKFFDHVRKRALNQLTDEHSGTEEFTTSIMDGLDLRETIRHWHDDKVYVKRERQPPGKVGPVILVWKDCPLNGPDWKTTLYAENQNESDISFCATQMGEEMIGPQISRSEYNSILSIYPSMGIPDVWQIPDLEGWRTCARLLIAAGILMSEERFVAVVSDHAPDSDLQEFARKHSRALIYLPLATFSRKTLRRLRHFHILNGKHVRGWAGDYIDD